MNIHFNRSSTFAISLFHQFNFSSLTTREKKIVALVSVIFIGLAALYTIKKYWFPPSDKVYVKGQKVNGTLEGQGKIVYPNGETHIGNFKGGKLDGPNCSISYPNGEGWDGTFDDGKFINGTKYNWKTGKTTVVKSSISSKT